MAGRQRSNSSRRPQDEVQIAVSRSKKLRKDRRFKDAMSLLNSVQASSSPNTRALNELIMVTSRVHGFEEVFGVLTSSPAQPNLLSINAALNACSMSNSPNVMNVVRRIVEFSAEKGIEVDSYSLTAVFRCCSTAGDAEMALKSAEAANERLDTIAMSSLISCLGKCGRVNDARIYFAKLMSRGEKPDQKAFSAMIQALGSSGRNEEAFLLYKEMKRLKMSPDPVLQSILVRVAASAGDIRKVTLLEQDFGTQAVCANEIVTGKIIEAYAKAGQAETAINRLLMLSRRSKVAESTIATILKNTPSQMTLLIQNMFDQLDRQQYLSVSAMNHFLSYFGRCDDVLSMQRVLHSLQTRGLTPSTSTYSIQIRAFSRVQGLNAGLHLYDKLSKELIGVDSQTFECLFRQCGKEKNLCVLKKLQKDYEESGLDLQESTLVTLLNAYGLCGEVSDIMGVLESIKASGLPLRKPLVMVVGELHKRGSVADSLLILSSLVSAGRLETVDVLVETYHSIGEYALAIQAFESCRTNPIPLPTKTLNNVLDCFRVLGKHDDVLRLFREIQDRKFESPPNAMSYNLTIQAVGQSRDAQLLTQILREMRNAKIVPDDAIYTNLIRGYGRSGEIKKAFSVFAEMEDLGFGSDQYSYSALIAACGSAKQPERAREVYEIARQRFGDRTGVALSTAALYCIDDMDQSFKIYEQIRNERSSVATSAMASVVIRNRATCLRSVQVANDLETIIVNLSKQEARPLRRKLARIRAFMEKSVDPASN